MAVGVIGVHRLEELLRRIEGLELDKSDVRRAIDLIGSKLRDLLVVANQAASANGRDVIIKYDLPLTLGLQRSLQEFQEMEEEIELHPILEYLATYPPLERALSDEVEQMLPDLAGALLVVLAHIIRQVDPYAVNPSTLHFERAMRSFKLTL